MCAQHIWYVLAHMIINMNSRFSRIELLVSHYLKHYIARYYQYPPSPVRAHLSCRHQFHRGNFFVKVLRALRLKCCTNKWHFVEKISCIIYIVSFDVPYIYIYVYINDLTLDFFNNSNHHWQTRTNDFFNNINIHPRMCVLSNICGNVDKHSPFDIYIYI